jgi:hypothetical protein
VAGSGLGILLLRRTKGGKGNSEPPGVSPSPRNPITETESMDKFRPNLLRLKGLGGRKRERRGRRLPGDGGLRKEGRLTGAS